MAYEMVKNFVAGGPKKKNKRPGFNELRRDRSRLTGEVCEMSNEIRELKETNVTLERANEDLTASNQRLVPQVDQLLRKVKNMDQELDYAQEMWQDLDRRYHDAIGNNKELEAQLKEAANARAERRATILALRQTNESYRQSVEKLQGQVVQVQSSMQARSHGQEKTSEADRKTIEDLKAQVIQHKATISASTRGKNQISDDVIKDRASQMFFSLQNFVVQKFRGIKLDYAALPSDLKQWMQEYMPDAQEWQASHRVKIIIGIISKTLVDRFNTEYCFGLSNDKHIRAAAELASLEPGDFPATKQWIELTRKVLLQTHDRAMEQAQNHLLNMTLQEIFYNLEKAVPREWSEDVQIELSSIIASAIELYRLLHSQTARFRVELHQVGIHNGEGYPFQPDVMEDLGSNLEEGQSGIVGMSVFPIIMKWGDERGENIDSMTVVSKAKVVARENGQLPNDAMPIEV